MSLTRLSVPPQSRMRSRAEASWWQASCLQEGSFLSPTFRRCWEALVLLVTVAGIVLLTFSTPVLAVDSRISNTAIYDEAMSYPEGSYGGQCKGFVNDVFNAVAASVLSPAHLGGGYYSDYVGAGGFEVSVDSAVRGDFIQLNGSSLDSYYDGMHSAIIIDNLGGNSFNVVDSNLNYSQEVHHHPWDPYAWAATYGLTVHIWRLGTTATWHEPVDSQDYLLDVDFVGFNQGWAVGIDGVIKTTTDGGRNWQSQNSNTTASIRAVDFVNSTDGWAVTDDGRVLATTTGGREGDGHPGWDTQEFDWPSADPRAIHFYDVAFSDRRNGWAVGGMDVPNWYGSTDPAIFALYTHDGGDTWIQSDFGGLNVSSIGATAVRALDKERALVQLVWNNWIRTDDGGTTWKAVSFPAPEPGTSGSWGDKLDVCFSDARNGWAVGQSGINSSGRGVVAYKTVDGGVTWNTKFYENSPQSTFVPVRVFTADPEHVWAVGLDYDGSTSLPIKAWTTADGGTNWAAEAIAATSSGLEVSRGTTGASFPDAEHGIIVGGHASLSYGPEQLEPSPIVTVVTPTEGPNSGGKPVTITGSGFTGATAVYFGSTRALSSALVSDTQMTAVAPAGIEDTHVHVSVVTPAGWSAQSPADLFTYNTDLSARPLIVLVGGLMSNTWYEGEWHEEWEFLRNLLRHQYDIYEAKTDDGASSPVIDSTSSSWDESARRLDAQLAEAGYHDRPVILVGHSMGGLISRAYADLPGGWESGCEPIAIIQSGTPNGGIAAIASKIGEAAGWTIGSAAVALSSDLAMGLFNATHTNWRDVPIYRIAGTFFPYQAEQEDAQFWSFTCWNLCPVIAAANNFSENDGVVPAWSVRSGPDFAESRYREFANGVHDDSNPLTEPFTRASDVVAPLKPSDFDGVEVALQIWSFIKEAEAANGQKAAPAPGSAALTTGAKTSRAALTMAAALADLESTSGSNAAVDVDLPVSSWPEGVRFAVEGSVLMASVSPDSGTVSVGLRTPAGDAVEFTEEVNQGCWTITADGLTPGGEYVLSADVLTGSPTSAIFAVLDSGPSNLRVSAPGQVDAGGEMVVTSAVYEDRLAEGDHTSKISTSPLTVSATLADSIPVAMHDDGVSPDETAGDGIYAATLIAPGSGSSIPLVVTASGEDSEGLAFQRGNTTQVTICEPRASLSGAPAYRTETDAFGQVTAVLVDVPVSASEGCDLRVSADITSAGRLVAQTSADGTLSRGEGIITLSFTAADLYPRLDVSGAFSVGRLTLVDLTDSDLAILDEARDALTGTLARSDLTYTGSTLSLAGTNPAATHDLQLTGSSSSTGDPVAGAEYSADGGDWMAVSDPEALWGEADVTWSLPFTLPDGVHAVDVRATASGGSPIVGTEASISFVVDTSGPWGTLSLTPTADPTKPLVVSSLSSLADLSQVTEMRFSVDDKASWSDWEPYAEDKALTLPLGAGIRTVYGQFKDEAGNMGELRGSVPVYPTISSLAPASASAGSTVIITGSGFTGLAGTSAVTFDGVSATGYVINSDTQIAAVAPAHDAGSVRVRVSAEGTASADTPADDFAYLVHNAQQLLIGWNLLAGTSGSDTGGRILFGFDASGYVSMTAANMKAGEGYWCKSSSVDTVTLGASASPIPISLRVGWNLIGNSSTATVTLPTGVIAFVYHDGSYVSSTTLAPGEGGWVNSSSEQVINLDN